MNTFMTARWENLIMANYTIDPASQEYRINHQRWQVNKVLDYTVDCNFAEMYGSAFAELSQQKPEAVFLAEGSDISVDWKRVKFY